MHIINITVRNKIAVNPAQDRYVCGNSDYVVLFDFDSEWDAFETKTARFVYGSTYQDVVFSGNECPVPIISNVCVIEVGVFAGNLSTTTPASVPASKSILCRDGFPADPAPDVYAQIMEKLNGLDGGSSSIADPGKAHQMLVSDAEGKAVWVDALAYKTTTEGVLLAETALTVETSEPGMYYIMTPWEHAPALGDVCTVTFEGTAYECTGLDVSALMGAPAGSVVGFGKTSGFGIEGGNEDAPFVLISLANVSDANAQGVYGMVVAEGYTEDVTLSVTGQIVEVKQIDAAFVPETTFTVNVELSFDTEGKPVFGTPDKTWAEVEAAYNAGKTIRVIAKSDTIACIGDVRFVFQTDMGMTMAFELYINPYMHATTTASRIVRQMYGAEDGSIAIVAMD